MRLCTQCGAPVRDADDFCGNCGTYLGWAAEPPAPQASADAAEERPGPVLPGRPEARRPLPSALDDEVVVGPPCPACGVANPPGRRFCRRCATPLRPGVSEARGRQARRRWRWRGDTSRWLRRLVAFAAGAVLLLAAIAFYPTALALVEDVRDKTSTPVAVGPTSTTATAEVPGHPAAAAVDGLSNRYWGATAVGDAVEFGFATPYRLLSVVVHTGAGVEERAFTGQARVAAMDMVVITADGGSRTVPLPLADRVGPQRVDTAVSGVVRIRLVVRAAAGQAQGRHIALGEVEFFRRP
ncbi:zinc ribbon domain-containing protein [Saccharothrix luteola]|uniref:zinc ribbon domain-containing protein n=1 Tax=Saccharothrix luteola TaxID=2893018 RepID=UPI001E4059C8|nr:zinc ribbon domain-containing protein [Saccharothrix luteola]MCC8246896.1 zinc-ribbon domain-containing protein [Saccharothrix luteola]